MTYQLSRHLLLVTVLFRVTATTAAVVDDAPTQYGFFGRQDTTTSSSTSTQMEGCSGFGCKEQREDSHENDDQQDHESGFKTIGSCTPVSLELATDGRPQDATFELVCNDAAVWTYPSALIPQEGAHSRIQVNACVFLEHACCHFALHDSHSNGDGMTALTEGDGYAYMELKVADETILQYNSQENPPFTTLAKSFGNTCNATPSINVTPQDPLPRDLDCPLGVERPLNFQITLDEHPEDLSWFLVCNSEDSTTEMVTVWDTPRGSLAGHIGQVAHEQACIPYTSTCSFTIIDSQGDGLSQGSGYTLTLGVKLIDAYVSEPFFEKSYCIGAKCGKSSYSSESNTNNHNTPTPTTSPDPKHDFQEELQQLEQQEQQEEALLEELKQDSETRQEEIQELLQEEMELQQEQQEQEQTDKPDWPKTQPPTNDATTEDLLKEEVILMQEQEESFQDWMKAGVGMVAFVFVMAALTAYCCMSSASPQSAAVKTALSPMKNGMFDSDCDESTEPDDGTFVLDA